MLVIGSSWLLGLVLRSRAAQVERQFALAASEHARERAAIEGERARIAREMHDVLAHSLVTIATLSDGAKRSLCSDPDAADEAISTIGMIIGVTLVVRFIVVTESFRILMNTSLRELGASGASGNG